MREVQIKDGEETFLKSFSILLQLLQLSGIWGSSLNGLFLFLHLFPQTCFILFQILFRWKRQQSHSTRADNYAIG